MSTLGQSCSISISWISQIKKPIFCGKCQSYELGRIWRAGALPLGVLRLLSFGLGVPGKILEKPGARVTRWVAYSAFFGPRTGSSGRGRAAMGAHTVQGPGACGRKGGCELWENMVLMTCQKYEPSRIWGLGMMGKRLATHVDEPLRISL